MLQLLPFLPLLAVGTAATLLAVMWWTGDIQAPAAIILCAWLAAGIYCQFFPSSAIVAAAGLALQTLLAIYLIVRWRLKAQ